MKKNWYPILLVLLPGALFARHVTTTRPAASICIRQAAIDTGIVALKKAVEAAPRDLPAHEEYIKAMGLSNPDLPLQYEKWMKKFPGVAVIPFALGHAYSSSEFPQAKSWLLKATAINDTLATAWSDLAIDAERWGSQEEGTKYMGKAAASNPSEPSYAFYYTMDLEFTQPDVWRTKIYELAKRFPTSERGAQGLYWLGYRSTDTAEKVRVFELLRTAYPPAKFNWSASGMTALFDVYLSSSPEKALALAKDMGSEKEWTAKAELADNIIRARGYLADHNTQAAGELLAKIKAPRYSDALEMITLLKAQMMDAMGNTAPAYDSLLVFCAKTPSDELQTAMTLYGSKLGKSQQQITADLWKLRETAKKPAPAFSLDKYPAGSKASLSDYKGKVVLLTFWFPGCGPCRGEFPHFETVMNKFKGKEVAYIGINVFPEQDDYVVSFMKGTHYSFTPLHGTSETSKEYKVRGEPSNYLIDPDGQIVYTNFRASDPHSERMLELMINSLLPNK